MTEFNPELTQEDQSAQAQQEKRIQRAGRRLAKRAIRLAGKGNLGENMTEVSGPLAHSSLRDDYPEASYEVARGLLAQDGLTVERVTEQTNPAERGSRANSVAVHMNVKPLGSAEVSASSEAHAVR